MVAVLVPLPAGTSGLVQARPELDLASRAYEEVEYLATGTATSYTCAALSPDGRFAFAPDSAPNGAADFVTRVVVRRPTAAAFSGTVCVEWLNVSSGADAAPDWTFVGEEILRAGHAWAGVSAQYVGVEGGGGSVPIEGMGAPPGLRGSDPDRYADLHHPGDAYMFDIYTQVAGAVRDVVGAEIVLAVGESQSGMTVATYANGVQPLTALFDGFLVHSRPAVPAPLGGVGAGLKMDEAFAAGPVRIRDDLDVPVLTVVTEGDLFERIGFLPARQPDTDRLRLWEIAGAAHADRYVIGEFEEILGCAVPVNRGQQWAVLRAALRALDVWARGGVAPPSAPLLETDGDDVARDDHGIALGGVRTPVVDAPAEVVSGHSWPGASVTCRLFGSTQPLDPMPWTSAVQYLASYRAATNAAVAAGFVLADDVEELLGEARPDLIPAHPHESPEETP